MPSNDEFAVAAQAEEGIVWRDVLLDSEAAKAKAQDLANREGVECFVFSTKDVREVARFHPERTREHCWSGNWSEKQELDSAIVLEIMAEMAQWSLERPGCQRPVRSYSNLRPHTKTELDICDLSPVAFEPSTPHNWATI